MKPTLDDFERWLRDPGNSNIMCVTFSVALQGLSVVEFQMSEGEGFFYAWETKDLPAVSDGFVTAIRNLLENDTR